jgi:small GTP-binding protein
MSASNRPTMLIYKKYVFLGDQETGKSSLLTQFCHGSFSNAYQKTIGVDFNRKQIEFEKTKMQLMVWEVGGWQYNKLIQHSSILDKTDFLGLVLDMTNKESFNNLPSYIQIVKNKLGILPPITVFANKYDLTEQFQVTEDEVRAFCKENGLQCYFVSATNHEQVVNAFVDSIQKNLNNLPSNTPVIKKEAIKQISVSQSSLETKPLFDDYLGHWYSFRIFKTHHKERAIAVKTALQDLYNQAAFNAAYFKEIYEKALKLIQNQIALLEGKTIDENEVLKELAGIDIDKNWVTKMINVPEKIETSGYYQELIRLKNEVEQVLLNNQNTSGYTNSSSNNL